MRIISKYQADDGKLFDKEEECVKYELILTQVDSLLNSLPNPKNYNLSNGNGYILHTPGTYAKIESLLVKLANDWFKPMKDFTHFDYYLGRTIDDSNMRCLIVLSTKLMCIRDEKEYDQPYYANYPNEVKNGQLN